MLNFVVAFQAEANPLIRHFKLKREKNTYFPVFSSVNTTLIISGMGRNLASAATAWLAATKPAPVWVNFGIAGHRTKDPGDLLVANKITESGTGKNWYPVHIKTPLETEQLTTFDEIQRSYHPDMLHDMEASGFFETAIRFTTAELTQSVKVVSDNETHPVESIDKTGVEEVITANIPEIVRFSDHLCQLAQEIQPIVPVALIDSYQERWRFSITQHHQLQRLLQRRMALGIDSNPASGSISLPSELTTRASTHNSKSVLRWLQNDTDAKAEFY